MRNQKEDTIILLIDFYGQPGLQDQNYLNRRYNSLLDIINQRKIDRNHCHIISNTHELEDQQMKSIEKFAWLEKWKWHNISKDQGVNNGYVNTTIEQFIEIVRKYDPNLHISPLKTNIIIGGTETSGCVFDNKNIGALHWAKRGYDTTIYLPLCCDYSSPGATWELKQLSGISSLWNTVGREIKNSIKNVNITQNLHLTASFDQLSPIIPWSNEKITPL